ncbi:thiol:disulfide interchange protein DsbD [Halospina denitrificans]|uniref:Thiol:disulfide interchange protein DsbD n=1 Tax=Halospina denitrificans TaxID=332522 RepID=A0A4R7JQ83_9GAMM|nr:protein-disulfide reductase DsbD [Halospina denitrificans]TDT39407.1 thiol:disulfide interchange protein DsbD [Halospina denitrificans]
MTFPLAHNRIFGLLALLLLLASPASAQDPFSGSGNGDFPPVEQAFPFTAYVDDGDLILDWEVTPEFYLYRDRIEISATPEGIVDTSPAFSIESKEKDDPYFGKVQVFYEDVQARLTANGESNEPVTVTVEWQGCAEAGLCYTPQTETIQFTPASGEVLYPAPEDTASDSNGNRAPATTTQDKGAAQELGSRDHLQRLLQSDSLLLGALIFYVLGLGLTFTPCVLPMIPIITAVVAGQRQLSTLQAFYLSVAYVLGMAVMYTMAGVLVGLLGASFNLQVYLQSPWVLGIFAGLFVLFALVMFGLIEMRIPKSLEQRLTAQSRKLSGGNVASVAGIGALSALIVSPCVTAPLAAALVYISATQDALMGGHALFWLSMGMGTPLILIGTGGRRFMPQPGPWMNRIKAGFGIMMLAVAIWLLERVIPAPLTLGLWAVLLAVTGVQLGAFEPVEAGWPRTRKGAGLVLVLAAAMLLAGALGGATDPLRPLAPFQAGAQQSANAGGDHTFKRIDNSEAVPERLAQARRDEVPVILDFYADWCISCKVMERNVFSAPEVQRAMSDYRLLQVDVTENTPSDQALLDRYGLFGPPTVLFFDASGEELSDARILGEMDREEFLQHLDRVSERIGNG